MKRNDFDLWLSEFQPFAEEGLRTALEASSWAHAPQKLKDAISYALMSGGKRVRPALAYLGCEVVGGNAEMAIPAGVAVEMIHTYSLIHDDLPCMDDDSLRRGQATVHVEFDEATAVLAGDALQSLGFEILAHQSDAAMVQIQTQQLAVAGGPTGMVGGQILDILASHETSDLAEVCAIHQSKTAALLACAFQMGVVAASKDPEPWRDYSLTLGCLFQATDDLLDATATTADLGKTAGKDAEAGKATLVSSLGLEEGRQFAENLAQRAKEEFRRLCHSPEDSPLYNLPDFLLSRCR
jgi:farnesyl diphosphate synthase